MTARSILVVGWAGAVSSNDTDFSLPPHGARLSAAGVDFYHYRPPVDVSFSNLAFFDASAGSGTGRTLKAYLNGSSSVLAVTIADGGAVGDVTENVVDSLSVSAGDRLSIVARKTGGSSMLPGHRVVMAAPGSSAVSPMVLSSGGVVFDHTSRSYPISGDYAVVTYSAQTRATVRSPGDWRGLYVHVTANSGSASATVKGGLNNADTAMSVSIGAGETGYFFDNTNVVAVADGDHLNYRKSGTSGASFTVTTIGSSIVHATRKQQLYGYAGRAWAFSLLNSGAYRGLPGPDYGNTVGIAQLPAYERSLGYPARISYLQVGSSTTLDADVTTTLLVNGSPSSLTATVSAGAGASLVEDAVNTVTVGPSDKIAFVHQSSGATAGTFNAASMSVLIEDLTVDPSIFTMAGTSTFSPVARASNTRSFAMGGSSTAAFAVLVEVPEVRTLDAEGTSTFSPVAEYVVSDFPIQAEIQTLTPSARIELFELDAAVVGGPIYRFHAGTNGLKQPLVWNGEEYSPFPVQATGFEYSGQGPLPRPKFRVANVAGVMSALVMMYEDLAGCKVTRIRTLAKFLDEVNFPAGNPTADPEAEYPREVYYIDRKASEDRDVVEFELSSSLDMAGVMFPARQVVQNYCPWAYRGAECSYTGSSYFDTHDQPVGSLPEDVCGKRLSSCRARFGQYGELPYGGFPAAGLLRL